MAQKKKPWLEFEEAVARFAAAMDPQAIVRHNAKLPDRDTKIRRQRDVWVEAKVCHHFPVRLLISCKRYGRKLHQGDIDAFIGELLSSRAHKGVIYSYSGFGEAALQKAEEHGICCCRLFKGEPADIPSSLSFTTHYCCTAQIQLALNPEPFPGWGFTTWGELLEYPLPGCSELVVDAISEAFRNAESEVVSSAPGTSVFPQPFDASITVPASGPRPPLTLTALGRWKFYRSRLEFVLLEGSYSYSSGDFLGSISSPWVNRFSTHPGPGWEQIEEAPKEITNASLMILYNADNRSALLQQLGQKALGSVREVVANPANRAEGRAAAHW